MLCDYFVHDDDDAMRRYYAMLLTRVICARKMIWCALRRRYARSDYVDYCDAQKDARYADYARDYYAKIMPLMPMPRAEIADVTVLRAIYGCAAADARRCCFSRCALTRYDAICFERHDARARNMRVPSAARRDDVAPDAPRALFYFHLIDALIF